MQMASWVWMEASLACSGAQSWRESLMREEVEDAAGRDWGLGAWRGKTRPIKAPARAARRISARERRSAQFMVKTWDNWEAQAHRLRGLGLGVPEE